MKTRMIAVTAAILLAAASIIPMAGAETTDNTETTPEVVSMVPIVGTEAATTGQTEAAEKETAAAPADTAETPAAAEEQGAKIEEVKEAELVVADVKTHHRFTEVAERFQVKVGKVSSGTKVCLWSTDCRKANTKIRRLSSTETLTVVAQSNGWYKVVDSNGVTGFVVRSRVTKA